MTLEQLTAFTGAVRPLTRFAPTFWTPEKEARPARPSLSTQQSSCLMLPNGCSTSSRRWFRISGRAAKRAATRSSTASLQARHTPGFVGSAARAERAGPAGVRVTVVDLLQPTHRRAVTRSKPLPSWAEISVAVWVVAKLVLAEEAAAHRRPPLRARHVGHNPGLLAGFEILGLEGARRSVSDAPSLPPAGRSSWTLSEDPRPS